MPLILCIDTALQQGEAALAASSGILSARSNSSQSDHAAWIHTAIQEMLAETGKSIKDLEAVAVSSGPGSYTGLRVGMATAKGLCYALRIPLITETTLILTAMSLLEEGRGKEETGPVLLCPMIDARRMEVFTGLYTPGLETAMEPQAMILGQDSFAGYLPRHQIVFAGNGSPKWKDTFHHPHAIFSNAVHGIRHLAAAASAKFGKQEFDDLAYTEPYYLKSVYLATPAKPSN